MGLVRAGRDAFLGLAFKLEDIRNQLENSPINTESKPTTTPPVKKNKSSRSKFGEFKVPDEFQEPDFGTLTFEDPEFGGPDFDADDLREDDEKKKN